MVNALVKRLFAIVVGTLVVLVVGLRTGRGQPQRPPDTMSLSGPRAGITYLSPGVVDQIRRRLRSGHQSGD